MKQLLAGVTFGLLLMLGACQGVGRGQEAGAAANEMLSELATELRFSRRLRSFSASATQSLHLMPVVGDGAADGGLRLWLSCSTTLDVDYLGFDPCDLDTLILDADGARTSLDGLVWQDERLPLPTTQRETVRATYFAVDAQLLTRIREARSLRLHEPEALDGVFELTRDTRAAWPTTPEGGALRFRARVGRAGLLED